MKKLFILAFFLKIVLSITFLFVYYATQVILLPPVPSDSSIIKKKRIQNGSDFFYLDQSWLQKNASGLWELYVEGTPYEMGVTNGKLTKELIIRQEDAFVNQISLLIPSRTYLNFLKYFIAWFNKDLDDYVQEEYQLEILGVSESASDDYGFIAPKYQRILNYHASHDIGHALQELHMVGCTSFAVWNERTRDSSIIMGRNFDLFLGDEFAKDKIVGFIAPSNGYKFMTVSWGGMIGVVSGMNEIGLAVTINAAKSDIPTGARTPISLVIREILQYASTIDEAYEIAKKRNIFVSESIMVASAIDNKTVIFEKSPDRIDMYDPHSSEIICTNHYQGEEFKNDELNIQNISTSASKGRYLRLRELLDSTQIVDYSIAAKLLRDTKGLGAKNIGYSNELSINQLLGHHSIIFKPQQKLVWVSTQPFQLGKYICYQLDSVFSNFRGIREKTEIEAGEFLIPEDSLMYSTEFNQYIYFRKRAKEIKEGINGKEKFEMSENEIDNFIASNTEYYYVYFLLGEYYCHLQQFENAIKCYNIALSKVIPNEKERRFLKTEIVNRTEKLRI